LTIAAGDRRFTRGLGFFQRLLYRCLHVWLFFVLIEDQGHTSSFQIEYFTSGSSTRLRGTGKKIAKVMPF
jgi:hypothetical protein